MVKRTLCDLRPANALGGKWAPDGAECQAPAVCTTAFDANAKLTKAKCEVPQVNNTGTDTTTTGQDATGGGDTATVGDSTTSVPDGTGGGDVTLNVTDLVKCMNTKCASQVAACKADAVCAAAFKCLEGCKDLACIAKCPQPPETNPAATAVQLCSSQQKCVPGATTPVCGNGACESGETPTTCAADCKTTGAVCGNNVCEAPGENVETCPKDCKTTGPVCGNNVCESPNENVETCPKDCKTTGPVCGNGNCESGETPSNCSADCKTTGAKCGDGKCASGENCPMDCDATFSKTIQCGWSACTSQMTACGANKDCVDFYNCMVGCKCDEACSKSKCTDAGTKAQSEIIAIAQCAQQKECPDPCGTSTGPKCGNGTCEAGETPTNCAADCKTTVPKCGNGTCEAGETPTNCAADCKATGAHVCDQYCGKGAPGGACFCDAVCLEQKDCCTADGKGKAATCAGSTCGECNGAAPPP